MSFIFTLFVFKISMVIINVLSNLELVTNIGIYYDDALHSKENLYTQYFSQKTFYMFLCLNILLTIDKKYFD